MNVNRIYRIAANKQGRIRILDEERMAKEMLQCLKKIDSSLTKITDKLESIDIVRTLEYDFILDGSGEGPRF